MRLCVVMLVVLALVGCGSKAGSKNAADSATTAATTTTTTATVTLAAPSLSRCERAAKVVVDYNTLLPGASRKEYLTLLHKLQLQCPGVAAELGLIGYLLPECQQGRFDQENCTMYSKP